MEASAMFKVARFRRVSVASVFVIGDSIADGRWTLGFNSPPREEEIPHSRQGTRQLLEGHP